MKRKTIASIAMLLMMLFSLVGSAAAQDEVVDDPITDPTTEVEQPGAKFFTHPVVKLLSAYFDQEVPDPSALPPSEPTDTDDDSGLGPIGLKIAAYHEDGMGFGVLVKIFSMIKASEEACLKEGAPEGCTPLTDEALVAMFKEKGMGALFKEYGKPAMLGVGHVKQELKAQEEETCQVDQDCDKVKEDKDKDKDKADKDKPANDNKPIKIKPEKPKKDK